MVVRDKVSKWFLRNVVKPRMEEIDRPGFITTNVGEGNTVREVFLPEKLLVRIEDEFVEEHGEEGRKSLYRAGKQFGYRYAKVSRFPQKGEQDKKEFEKFFDFFIKYIETIYAKEISYTLDYSEEILELELKEYAVCSKNGKGHIMTEGAIAGVMAYMFSNTDIETSHKECEGRESSKCVVEADTYQKLDLENTEFSQDVFSLKKSEYRKYNEVRDLKLAKNSMKDLLDRGFFSYKSGILYYGESRYVIVESGLVYFLEIELGKLEGGKSLLYDISKEVFRSEAKSQSSSFIEDYVPALGWGGIKTTGKGNVHSASFPWTRYASQTDHCVYRGMIAGLVSATERDIDYKGIEHENISKGFDIKLIEE